MMMAHHSAIDVPAMIACKRAAATATVDTELPSRPSQFAISSSSSSECGSSVMAFDCATSVSSLNTEYNINNRIPPATPPNSTRQLYTVDEQHRKTQTVRVNVSGEDFSFPLSTFQKFAGLPWKLDDNNGSVLCLNSSAAVFEVLLDYALFGTLPAYDTMSHEEFQEFETMALAMGGLTKLIEHFDRKDSYLAKELRHGRRRRSSATDRHFILNPEDSQNSGSPNSAAATKCVRFLGALSAVAETIIRRRRPRSSNSSVQSAGSSSNSSTQKRVKLVHD